jgi:hypothetical protein
LGLLWDFRADDFECCILRIPTGTSPAVRKNIVDALEGFSVLKLAEHKFSQEYYTLTTRFGDLRAVRFEIVSDGVSKTCVGFHKPESGPIYIKGYACSRDPAEVSPALPTRRNIVLL